MPRHHIREGAASICNTSRARCAFIGYLGQGVSQPAQLRAVVFHVPVDACLSCKEEGLSKLASHNMEGSRGKGLSRSKASQS